MSNVPQQPDNGPAPPQPGTPSNPPQSRPNAGPPPTVVIQTGRSTWGRLVSWAGWIGFTLCALMLFGQMAALSDYFDTSEGIEEKFHSGKEFGRDKVAIITVSGVIMEGDGFVKKQIDRVREDDNVKAVVLRVESPGGTVTGSDFMYHHLNRLKDEKKVPLVVSMGSIATSGGYYVAMAVGDQEKAIYAEPTCTTGSIGVVIPHYDLSGLLQRFDIKDDSIATHPRKLMLSMTRPMDEDERQLVEKYINESFTRFKDIVKSGRPVFREQPERLDELATGEVFTANQALESGLIDEIGFIEKAIDRAVELAGLDKSRVRVVRFEKPTSLLSLGAVAQSHSPQSQWAELLERSTPRAYYLWTTLPPLLRSP